jgi:hypothetical protein
VQLADLLNAEASWKPPDHSRGCSGYQRSSYRQGMIAPAGVRKPFLRRSHFGIFIEPARRGWPGQAGQDREASKARPKRAASSLAMSDWLFLARPQSSGCSARKRASGSLVERSAATPKRQKGHWRQPRRQLRIRVRSRRIFSGTELWPWAALNVADESSGGAIHWPRP